MSETIKVETTKDASGKNILEIKNMHTWFHMDSGIVKSVDGVDIELKEGSTLGIVGESGSGKSVTALSVMGLLMGTTGKIEEGEILLDGKDIVHIGNEERRKLRGSKISMIFQEPMTSLNPVMKIGDQIMEAILMHQKVSKKEAEEKAIEMLRMTGLPRVEKMMKEYPFQLSGGQRQRVNIARALSMEPKIIVCDEPVSALDVSIQAQVINLFRRLQKQFNLTYVFISHDLGIIKYISDRIMIMYLGRVMEFYTSEGIYADPKHPYTQALLSAIPPESPFEKKERLPLTGDIPSPIGDQVGCPLAGRCPHCTERCKKEIPKLVDTGDGHMVACFLYE